MRSGFEWRLASAVVDIQLYEEISSLELTSYLEELSRIISMFEMQEEGMKEVALLRAGKSIELMEPTFFNDEETALMIAAHLLKCQHQAVTTPDS